jgi:hypothetical protein
MCNVLTLRHLQCLTWLQNVKQGFCRLWSTQRQIGLTRQICHGSPLQSSRTPSGWGSSPPSWRSNSIDLHWILASYKFLCEIYGHIQGARHILYNVHEQLHGCSLPPLSMVGLLTCSCHLSVIVNATLITENSHQCSADCTYRHWMSKAHDNPAALEAGKETVTV